jgi:hypothetical protein
LTYGLSIVFPLNPDLKQEVSGLSLEEEVEEGDGVVPESGLDLPLGRVQRQA